MKPTVTIDLDEYLKLKRDSEIYNLNKKIADVKMGDFGLKNEIGVNKNTDEYLGVGNNKLTKKWYQFWK